MNYPLNWTLRLMIGFVRMMISWLLLTAASAWLFGFRSDSLKIFSAFAERNGLWATIDMLFLAPSVTKAALISAFLLLAYNVVLLHLMASLVEREP